MIMKANKQIGFIYKDNESIDKILKDGEVVFERGFLREKTSTTLPITFGGVGKDLKDYKIYGNTYQNSTRGNQLLDFKNYSSITVSISKVLFENDVLTIEQTSSGTFQRVEYNVLNFIKNNPGKKLKFSYKSLDASQFNSSNNQICQLKYTNNGSTSYVPLLYKTGTQQTFSIPSDTSNITSASICFYTNNSKTSVSNSSFTITEPLLYFDENSEYEPYTGGQPSPNPDYPQEIISCGDLITDSQDENYGKYKIPVNVRSDNLFDKSNANIINAYIGENYNWVYSGSAICYRIKCKPNTSYTITCFNPNETIFRGAVTDSENVPTSGNPLSIQSVVRRTDNTPITINTRTNTKYILVQLSSSQYLTSIETLQIVEGSTAPSKYIPYYNETTNIYLDESLRKIGEYSDYIDFINGKIVRRIKEVLLSSENNWASASNTRPVFSLSTFTDKLDGRDNFICSHFKYLGNAQQTDLGFAMSFNSGQYYRYLYIQVPSNIAGVAEVSNFKTWFGTIEPVTLDYPLATPTEESITLPNIPTIDGNNTLNIETEITPSQVYIKYKSNT